jgi:hypothetical protein
MKYLIKLLKFLQKLFQKKETVEYLYKYTPHNTEYKYDIITKSQLWFSKVESFNDPIDSKLDYRQQYTQKEIRNYWMNFLKNNPHHPQLLGAVLQNWGHNTSFISQQVRVYAQQKSEMGVLCFSANPKNILMWSHYANNHKGIVYEFKADLFLNCLTAWFTGKPYKVIYPITKSYRLLSYTLTGKSINDQFVKELTTKAIDWKYEEEFRMIDLEKNGNKNFNKLSLNSIIFGVKTSDDEIDVMRCLCDKYGYHHVKFKKAEFVKGKFEIVLNDI